MLNCQHITVKYGKTHPVVRDISFEAKAGEITALLGENGCGKSTVLRAIMGEVPFEGQMTLGESDLRSCPPAERALRVSLLPQQLPSPALSVWETVALGRAPHTTHLGDTDRAMIGEKLEELGIAHLAHRRTDTLSGGERQKVFVAMLLVQDTPLVLLDEPTTYMDLSFTARFFDILQRERQRGKAILLVMHDLADAFDIADRLLILQNGGIAFSGTPDEALAENIPEGLLGLRQYTAKRGEKTAYFFKGK